MKFQISLQEKTLYNFMRQKGYAPDGVDEKTGQYRFFRSLTQGLFPRFHVYATVADNIAALNLHCDQKKPSYKGTHAHSGEYDGALVETEAERIRTIS